MQTAAKLLISEWHEIDTSGLPPDSKAAAAHQMASISWSDKITDPKFKDYGKTDESTVSKALHGDHAALAKLPTSVAEDVTNFEKIKM